MLRQFIDAIGPLQLKKLHPIHCWDRAVSRQSLHISANMTSYLILFIFNEICLLMQTILSFIKTSILALFCINIAEKVL